MGPSTTEQEPAARSPGVALPMAAEAFGTFLLVFLGCGAVHTAVLLGSQSGLWQVAIVWGLAIMLAVFAVGAISGAHINPAITIALAAWGLHPWRRVLPYVVAQMLGAFAAAAVLFTLFSGFIAAKEQEKGVARGEPGSIVTAMCYGEYYPNPGPIAAMAGPYDAKAHAMLRSRLSHTAAWIAEFLGTMLLGCLVFALTDPRNAGAPAANLAPVFIGLTVSALISVLAPLTQACFNPARDFGPRLFAYFAGWGNIAIPGLSEAGWLMVYILAPIAGAVAGGGFYQSVLRSARPVVQDPRMRIVMLLALFLALPCNLLAQDSPTSRLDPLLPYQAERSHAVIYDVDFSIVVTPPYKTKKLQVWLPIPTSDEAQEVSRSRLGSFPVKIEPQLGIEGVYGNQFAYFQFDAPQGAQIIRHQFRVKVWELRWNVDPARVTVVQDWPAGFDKYRRGDTQAVVVDERFAQLLNTIIPDQTNTARDLGSIMNWVQANFEYDHHDASLQASSEHALIKRRGHCSDYHSFCASLGRAMGVPTRVTYGINTFPKNSPSHCKLEAFLDPYGWVAFDVSETQKLVSEIRKAVELDEPTRAILIERAQARLARGFRENTWFLQTRGTDYELAPKASKRVPVVRTAYVEADGAPLPEPDPADTSQKSFSWMTVHDYRPDRSAPNPYTDWNTLQAIEAK